MSKPFILYTVSGPREPYYAAVDWETGRLWTSPTPDGAVRQARDAGLMDFTEQNISRDMLLKKLGVGSAPAITPSRESDWNRMKEADAARKSRKTAPPTSSQWFVPGDGFAGADVCPPTPLNARSRGRAKKPNRAAKTGSPFAGSQPIDPSASDAEDILIVPSADHDPTPPKLFADGEDLEG